jgi:5-(carboxyamino)imidazole ribonucleotide synthase
VKARTILPGETLGVFGGGQLGRMFALAARRMGYRVHVFTPEHDSPAGQVADAVTNASYDDDTAVARFAQSVRAATFEFENVPASVGTAAAAVVRPAAAFKIAQDRRNEALPRLARVPVPRLPWCEKTSTSRSRYGLPAVLKTATMGYDGKGQRVLRKPHEAHAAWIALGRKPCLLEAFVDFAFEVSVVSARDPKGSFRAFPVFENQHTGGILDVTVAPARTGDHIAAEAVDLRGTSEEL